MFKPSAEALRAAVYLTLGFRACSKVATGFIAALAAEVSMHGGRKNIRRSEKSQASFQDAVSAIVGGLLVNWQWTAGRTHSKTPSQGAVPALLRSGLSYRLRAKESFTGERVSFRQFDAALRGLQEAGYVETVNGHRQFRGAKGDPGGFVGRSYTFRLWPTARLLLAAEEAGLNLADVRRHFHLEAAVQPPVVLHALTERRGGEKVKGEGLPLPKGFVTDRIAAEGDSINAFAALHRAEVAGEPVEVAWHRRFIVDFHLHGRWYVWGESYVRLSERTLVDMDAY